MRALASVRTIGALPSGRRDGEFVVYDLATGQIQQRWQGPTGACGCLVFHPDGRQFAADNLTLNNAIRFWDADSGRLLGELPQRGPVESIAWNRDGTRLAVTLSQDPFIRLWDVPARKQVRLLEGHKNFGIHSVFHTANDLLASSGWEGMLRLWNPKTGKELLSLPGYVGQRFSRDGDRIFLMRRSPQIWEVADSREYRTFVSESIPGKQEPYDLSVSPDGHMVAAGMKDGTRIWDMASGRELAFLPTGFSYSCLIPAVRRPELSLVGMGSSVGPSGPTRSGKGVLRIGPPEPLLVGGVARVAQSQDGRTVAAIFNQQGAVVLNLDQPEWAQPVLPHSQAQFVSVSPDGRWVATGTHNGNGIKVWSVRDNKLERELLIKGSAIPMFSPDGRWLYTNCATERRLWKVGSWEPRPTPPAARG